MPASTYDDGLVWLQTPAVARRPKTVVSLGSSIGNFSRDDGAAFLKSFGQALRPGDALLVGIDACKDPERVYRAYNDCKGTTHSFILNGLLHANRLLQTDAFDLRQWRVIGDFDRHSGKHHAFVSPLVDTVVDGVLIKADERLFIEQSFKYDETDLARLWDVAALKEGARWTNARADYGLHMAYHDVFTFSSTPSVYAARPVPTYAEWQDLWALWDMVNQGMIPKQELLAKPIKLRNACIFYIGHIPTFLAIHLHRATGKSVPKLDEYRRIFERGIDPDVENPDQCHEHSIIPDEWPAEADILEFQKGVRELVRELCEADAGDRDHATGQALWIGFEHEVMHVETLLYMLVESDNMLPPPKVVCPDFAALAAEANAKEVPNQWFEVPARTITLGVDEDTPFFTWDNEKPKRSAPVKAFSAQARPITNGEYAKYLQSTGVAKLPASWTVTDPKTNGARRDSTLTDGHVTDGHATNGHAAGPANGVHDTHDADFCSGITVRNVFGGVPLKFALHWPVVASYEELAGCAAWYGGRIPTLEEVKSIYEYVEELKSNHFDDAVKVPAVNGHLINDGVEETPPNKPSVNGAGASAGHGPSPRDLFINLETANVGFKHWSPVSVVQNGGRLGGQGDMGGAWEWTSTVLERHDGFEPMSLYPGYTADFFDQKHNIVLGGSWATHPRVAGRKSFVNWYQRTYPYAWAGARLVRDL